MAAAKGVRAAIYARYSSHNQRDVSIEIQLDQCRAYCEEHGLEVVGEYCDRAKSGRSARRAQFQRMLVDAGRREFDYVVIYKVTRIMRNRDEMALARLELRKHGIDILYAGEQIGDGSSGILQLGLLEVLAEWESALLSERVRDGIRKNAEQCKANGQTLYGWDIVDGYYVVNERERTVLDEARRVVVAGGSVADAVRALAAHRTKAGKRFAQQSLTNMLRRPQNCGTYCYAGTVVEDGMPALWSKADQAQLERVLDSGARHPSVHAGYERFSLTGRLFHEHHGELFGLFGWGGTSRSGKRYRYYKCRECNRTVRAEKIEAEVAQAVLVSLADEGTRERIADLICSPEMMAERPSRADAIRDELHEIELTYERVWKAIAEGYAPPGGREHMDQLKARQARLEGELAVEEAREELVLDRNRVLFWLEQMAQASDGQIIDIFVSRVVVTEDGALNVILMADDEDPPDPPFDGDGAECSVSVEHGRPRYVRQRVLNPLAFFLLSLGRGHLSGTGAFIHASHRA